HAIAVARGTPGFELDDDRPLTPKGIRRMRQGAAGLRRLFPRLDVIYTSPLVRAAETARLLAGAWPGPMRVETVPLLAPGGGPAAVARWLLELPAARSVALVGHEPGCSALLAQLLHGHGRRDSPFEFKKGGAALVEM